MLKGEPAAVGEVGDGRAGDHRFSVQHDLHGLAFDRDLEMVPFADRFVGLGARGDGGTDIGRCLGIHPDAVHLARPDRPAPDIHLKKAVAAKEDTGISVGKGERSSLPWMSLACVPSGKIYGNVLVDERCFLEPPVELQDEVAIFAVAPERFVALGLAAGVVIDDAIDDFPVAVVALGHFPAGQILPLNSETKPGAAVGGSPLAGNAIKATRQ